MVKTNDDAIIILDDSEEEEEKEVFQRKNSSSSAVKLQSEQQETPQVFKKRKDEEENDDEEGGENNDGDEEENEENDHENNDVYDVGSEEEEEEKDEEDEEDAAPPPPAKKPLPFEAFKYQKGGVASTTNAPKSASSFTRTLVPSSSKPKPKPKPAAASGGGGTATLGKRKSSSTATDDGDEDEEEDIVEIRRKWFGMIDQEADEETRKYQTVVALGISKQTNPKVVADAMGTLRTRGLLTVDKMAEHDLQELCDLLRSVHYNKQKAKQTIEMAKMLKRSFRGKVPMNETLLVQLPGIGPKLAKVMLTVWDPNR